MPAIRKRRSPPPGSSPGALAIPPGAPRPRIHAFCYDAEHLTERDVPDVETLAGLVANKRVLWVDVQGLGDERVLRRLGELFHLHPLLLADVVNVPQRPKVESYDDVHLIVTRTVEFTGGVRSYFDREVLNVYDEAAAAKRSEGLKTRFRSDIEAVWKKP